MVKLALIQQRVSLGKARFGRTVRPTLVVGPKESVPVWATEMKDGIGGDILQVFAFDTDDLPGLEQQYGLGKLMDKLREETDMIVTSYAFLTLTQVRTPPITRVLEVLLSPPSVGQSNCAISAITRIRHGHL